jgi:hypothetical protein
VTQSHALSARLKKAAVAKTMYLFMARKVAADVASVYT